jgi:hypothetical protein
VVPLADLDPNYYYSHIGIDFGQGRDLGKLLLSFFLMESIQDPN